MTTFGPTKSEITSFENTFGKWSQTSRAKFVKSQFNEQITSHREYFRKRTNVKWDNPSATGRSAHPCSPYSLWRKYTFTKEDVKSTKTGERIYFNLEIVEQEKELDNINGILYEVDTMEDVKSCGRCSFEDSKSAPRTTGYSGMGFYNFGKPGDYIEWSINTSSSGMNGKGEYPISFHYAVGRIRGETYVNSRPLELYINNVLVEQEYKFGSTGGWSQWLYSSPIMVQLNEGQDNTIKLRLGDNSLNGGPNIDHLRLNKPSAIIMKDTRNGYARTVARYGIGRTSRFTRYPLLDMNSIYFDADPLPPQGYQTMGMYGQLSVNSSKILDIGNPPIDFDGYEEYLPEYYFEFNENDVFIDTGSQLYDYPIQSGQELLLRDGSTDPICDSIPLYANEEHPPVFGRLANGEWVQWTPTLILEQNGPSVNDTKPEESMNKGTLRDGGGSVDVQTGGAVSCSNVPRSFVNEDTCFLSTDDSACIIKNDVELQISLTPSNINAIRTTICLCYTRVGIG